MTLPSYQQITNENARLKRLVASLSIDPDYYITTRAAIPHRILTITRNFGRKINTVTLLSLRNLDFSKIDYVKRALHSLPEKNRLVTARWSRYEIVFLMSGDSADTDRLKKMLRLAFDAGGISDTIASITSKGYQGDIKNDVHTLEAIAQAHQEGHEF